MRVLAVLKRIAVVVVAVVSALLLVELGMRAYFTFFGTQIDRITYVYTPQQIMAANPAFIGLPFIGHGGSAEPEPLGVGVAQHAQCRFAARGNRAACDAHRAIPSAQRTVWSAA